MSPYISTSRALYLVAILFPSNVTADLVRVQNEAYSRTGWISSRALTPLIPLAWIAGPRPVEEISKQGVGCSISIGGFERVENVFAASIDWECGPSPTHRVRTTDRVSADTTPDGHELQEFHPPFPAGEFVYLALVDDRDSRAAFDAERQELSVADVPLTGGLPDLPRGRISTYRLACLEIRWQVSDGRLRSASYRVLSQRWIRDG
jgi:hypothetical protein